MPGFGVILKRMLKERRMTVLEFAEAVHIPLKSVHEWIQNDRFPRDPEVIKKIALYLGCSTHRLMFDCEDPNANTLEGLVDKLTLHTGTYEIVIRRVSPTAPTAPVDPS